MRAVSSSRSMASPWRLCWEKGDLSPNKLQLDQKPGQSKMGHGGRIRKVKEEVNGMSCTGRTAIREEHSVPCRRRGETEQAHWLSSNSASPASSVSLPFVLLPFLTQTLKQTLQLRSKIITNSQHCFWWMGWWVNFGVLVGVMKQSTNGIENFNLFLCPK